LGVGRDLDVITVIIPSFDEMHRLPARSEQFLALADRGAEVLFVDDGSRDGTGDYLEQIAAGRDGVRVLHLPENRGKGAAVRTGVAFASREVIVFMDADLATDLADLHPLLAALETHDVAIGSRATALAVVSDASLRRRLMGGTFNWVVRTANNLPFRDTQCGFKAFRAPFAKVVFAASRLDGFAFDVEILALSAVLGGSVVEIPVHWEEVPGSHIHLGRDAVHMAWDVLRTRRARGADLDLLLVRLPHDVDADLHDTVVALIGHPAFADVDHLYFVCGADSDLVDAPFADSPPAVAAEAVTARELLEMMR